MFVELNTSSVFSLLSLDTSNDNTHSEGQSNELDGGSDDHTAVETWERKLPWVGMDCPLVFGLFFTYDEMSILHKIEAEILTTSIMLRQISKSWQILHFVVTWIILQLIKISNIHILELPLSNSWCFCIFTKNDPLDHFVMMVCNDHAASIKFVDQDVIGCSKSKMI